MSRVLAAVCGLALVGGLAAAESAAPPAAPYRRFVPLAYVDLAGSRFEHHEKGAGITGSFPDRASLEGAKARFSVRLERTLPPGRYQVFLSIPYVAASFVNAPLPGAKGDAVMPPAEDGLGLDEVEKSADGYKKEPAGLSVEVLITLGDAAQKLLFPRLPGKYEGAVIIEVAQPWQTLTVQVLSLEPKITFNQLYVTSQPGDFRSNRQLAEKELVYGIDRQMIRQELNGQRAFLREPDPPNLLRNGSFEVGPATYYWCMPYQSSQTVNPGLLDEQIHAGGERSLCLRLQRHRYVETIAPSAQILHQVLKLKPRTTYHFRGLFKGEVPTGISVSLEPAYGPEVVTPPTVRRTVGTAWEPVTGTLRTTDEDRGYYLTVAGRAQGKAQDWQLPFTGEQLKLWVDDLCLSPQPAAAFVPAAPVELGVTWEVPGKVFHREVPITFTLLTRNYDATTAATVTVQYRVVDYFDRTAVAAALPPLAVTPGTTQRQALPLPLTATGAYRLLVQGRATLGEQTLALPLEEYAFAVLPRPPAQMANTFGAYINVTPEPLAIMARAGIRKTVTLSCSNEYLSNWQQMEPRPGEFVWRDDLVAAAAAQQVEIVANLEAQDAPAWAMNPTDEADAIRFDGARLKTGSISRQAWGSFVEQAVRHYRGQIRTWLIVDEPYHYFSMKSYFDVVKTAALAARRADPDCRVLAHCCYYPGNLPALEKLGLADYVDGLSGYSRDPAQGEKLRRFATKHGKSLMTAEYNWQVSAYQTIETPQGGLEPFWRLPTYRQVGAQLAALPLRSMAWAGSTGFNRYDARYPGGDFQQLDNYKCMFEYDGALKPSAVAFAVAAQLLDGFRGVGELKLNDAFETFLFERAGPPPAARFALTFWLRQGLRHAPLPLPAGVVAYDIMGNPLRAPPQPVLFSADVIYLIGPLDQLDATKKLLAELAPGPVVKSTATVLTDDATGQYLYRVTVKNLLATEPMKVRVGARAQRNFWEGVRDLGEIGPGAEAQTTFGLNAYQAETDTPRHDGHYLYLEALGTAVQ